MHVDMHMRWCFRTSSLESRGWDSETTGEKSISHGKPYKMYFLEYFTLQCTLVMLITLRKVDDHENHVRWIYLTTVLYMWRSQKYTRTRCPIYVICALLALSHCCPEDPVKTFTISVLNEKNPCYSDINILLMVSDN